MSKISLNVCGKITRVLFIILNIFFLLLGLALLGLGIYLLVSNQNFAYITSNQYASGAALILAAGIITIIITGLGLTGAFGLYSILLGIYTVLVVLIIVLEIVGAILGFVYYRDVDGVVTGRAMNGIDLYRRKGDPEYDGSVNEGVDFIQNTFDCCGWDSPSDWEYTTYINETGNVPMSCMCNNSVSVTCDMDVNIWTVGCRNSTITWFRQRLIAVGGVGIAFGILEILGIILAVGIICCVRTAKNQYTVV